MRNVLTALLTSGALLGVAGGASAADPATTTFTVTATVEKNCTVAAVPLTFTYTPGAGNVANNTTVTVNCTGPVVVEVDLVLHRSSVLGPQDLRALSGQVRELLELALAEPEPGDALKLTHCCSLQTPA